MKILITNHHLINIAGSEVVTLELARLFKNRGHLVQIATFSYGYPLKEYFLSEGLIVSNVLQDANFRDDEFDLIWAHHAAVLDYLIFNRNISAKKIVSSMLSPYEPLEVAPAYANQLSICLVNSEETRIAAEKAGVHNNKVHFFPNSAPPEFFDYCNDLENRSLRSIAVVSNHIPDEVLGAGVLLKQSGVKFDCIGLSRGAYHVLTPEVLAAYDAVVTIGKTVQFCLALRIPVYCYDIFGGPGWIREDMLSLALDFNFSGRCSRRKRNAKDIYNEIINGYTETLRQSDKLADIAQQRFALDKNVSGVIDKLVDISNVDMRVIRNFYLSARQNEYYVRELKNRLELDQQLVEMDRKYKILLGSYSWRITAPLRWFADVVKKVMPNK